MKILLRNFNNEVYVWKDAKYSKNGFVVDDTTVYETNVVSIHKDNRNQYVRCSACGEIFRKGSAKWEKHKQPITDASKCFTCKYLRTHNAKANGTKYKALADGKYEQIVKYTTELVCCVGWKNNPIDSDKARESCALNACRNAEERPISDIFSNMPGVFDDIITVDKILKAGYNERNEYPHESRYRLKARNTIFAYVNNANILDHFAVEYRYNRWTVYYSKKYHKLFTYTSGPYGQIYKEWRPSTYDMPANTSENILKKIASLYD